MILAYEGDNMMWLQQILRQNVSVFQRQHCVHLASSYKNIWKFVDKIIIRYIVSKQNQNEILNILVVHEIQVDLI